jgi:2,4-dienoyl-CoA reductase-like NADH-dependent reductase (Old Yellow Enzyme family)
MSKLYEPVTIGKWLLPNRMVMAPLTRSRSADRGIPHPLAPTYYAQRASAGLIITEGTAPSGIGQGIFSTPGIHTPEQIAAWRAVAEAVHAEGGTIVLQLMHAGRVAHPANKGGLETVAPSALPAPGEIRLSDGSKVPHALPRALAESELPAVAEEFASAARNAVDAGLDGVELHAANGFLLHEFLAPSSNHRNDAYGGSPQRRARFVIEVAAAAARAIGPERVGLRISPGHELNGIVEDDPADRLNTYSALVAGLSSLGIAYLHLLCDPADPLTGRLRSEFEGSFIVSTGFAAETDRATAEALVDDDVADAAAIGRAFLANPDLVRRWRTGREVNVTDPASFYVGGEHGYTDYPFLDD